MRSLRAMQSRAFRNPLAWAALAFPLMVVIDNKLIPVAMGLVLIAAGAAAWPWKLRVWPPLAAGFCLLLLWGLLSASWSIDPGNSLERFGKLLLTVAAGALLCLLADRQESVARSQALRWLAAGLLIAGAAALFREIWLLSNVPGVFTDFLRARPLKAYNSVAVLLSLMLLATLRARPVPWLALAALAVSVASALLGGNNSSVIALAAGLAAFGAVLWLGRSAVKALVVLLPVAFLAVPVSVGALDLPSRMKEQGWTVEGSVGHRMIIWRYAADKIQAKPILGWGLYSARLLPDRENLAEGDPHYADIVAVTRFGPYAKVELMPLHPHNATLQLWLDLGVVGAILYAALYGLCLLGLLRVETTHASLAGGVAAMTGAFVMGQLSFSAWQSWWLCAQFLVAALYLLAARKSPAPLPTPMGTPVPHPI